MKNTVGFKVTPEEKEKLIETASSLGISVDALLRHYVTKGRRKQPAPPKEQPKATAANTNKPPTKPKVNKTKEKQPKAAPKQKVWVCSKCGEKFFGKEYFDKHKCRK